MRINTQFPVAVHILAVLSYFADGPVPSEKIAASVGTNPVVVRRILARLKRHGMVETKPGGKGSTLCREPGTITLQEIYDAVRSGKEILFDFHPNPHPDCPVGATIADALATPLQSAQSALETELASFTLLDVVESMRLRNGRHGKGRG
ncbi:MAG: Rrf2 family transcriptional regulator [Planctomycetaceae bacterium]|nr:Rrf2 family transcriptional regulator [Planctomycetaceae bacterium]